MIWVLRLEPSNDRTWITASNNHPLVLSFKLSILWINKLSNISKRLWCSKPLQVFIWPPALWIIEGLRETIVSMLKGHQFTIKLLSKRKSWRRNTWWIASPLSADVQENWAVLLVPCIIVLPVSRLERSLLCIVEVVELHRVPFLIESIELFFSQCLACKRVHVLSCLSISKQCCYRKWFHSII